MARGFSAVAPLRARLSWRKAPNTRENKMAYAKQSAYFSEINVAPLTDVFLVLLVIMMLIVPLAEERAIKVSPPGKGGTAEANAHVLTAAISADGTIKINGTKISPASSSSIQREIEKEQKRQGTKDIVLQLASDPLAKQQDVVTVMDAALGAGVSSVAVLPLDPQ